jgi:hypothetical protein
MPPRAASIMNDWSGDGTPICASAAHAWTTTSAVATTIATDILFIAIPLCEMVVGEAD